MRLFESAEICKDLSENFANFDNDPRLREVNFGYIHINDTLHLNQARANNNNFNKNFNGFTHSENFERSNYDKSSNKILNIGNGKILIYAQLSFYYWSENGIPEQLLILNDRYQFLHLTKLMYAQDNRLMLTQQVKGWSILNGEYLTSTPSDNSDQNSRDMLDKRSLYHLNHGSNNLFDITEISYPVYYKYPNDVDKS